MYRKNRVLDTPKSWSATVARAFCPWPTGPTAGAIGKGHDFRLAQPRAEIFNPERLDLAPFGDIISVVRDPARVFYRGIWRLLEGIR